MQTKKFSATAPKFSKLQDLAVIVQTGTQGEILAAFKSGRDFIGRAGSWLRKASSSPGRSATAENFAKGGNFHLSPFNVARC
jgi:hypothetical protein